MKLYPLLLTLVCVITACSDKKSAETAVLQEVGFVQLKTEPVILQTELSGRTSAALNAEVRPQVTGIIKNRLFEEGSFVKADQVLYQIDPAAYQAAVNQAQATLANAEAAVNAARLKDLRYKDLLNIEGVSQQDADDAHASYLQALASVAQQKAALSSAMINLAYTKIRAPISGKIGKSSVTSGALVTENQTTALATIRTLDPIYVDLAQSNVQLLQLRKILETPQAKAAGTDVTLQQEDGSIYELKGKLKFSEISVDETTGSVTLRAEFPNPKGELLPGSYVRAILDEAILEKGILAPQQGITRDAKGNAIALVINQDNKVEQHTVTTQRAIGTKWLISEGLSANDRLIIEGSNKVKQGDTVKPVEVKAKIVSATENTASTSQSE